jgi:hypothetical protein
LLGSLRDKFPATTFTSAQRPRSTSIGAFAATVFPDQLALFSGRPLTPLKNLAATAASSLDHLSPPPLLIMHIAKKFRNVASAFLFISLVLSVYALPATTQLPANSPKRSSAFRARPQLALNQLKNLRDSRCCVWRSTDFFNMAF